MVVDRQGKLLANLSGSLRNHALRLILRIQPRSGMVPEAPTEPRWGGQKSPLRYSVTKVGGKCATYDEFELGKGLVISSLGNWQLLQGRPNSNNFRKSAIMLPSNGTNGETGIG